MTKTIGCTEFVANLDAHFDAATDRSARDAHLAGCPDCRARLAAMEDRLRDLPCDEFVELVTDYLEDAVDARGRERIDDHLRLCEGCRTYLDQMRETIRALGHAIGPEDDPAARRSRRAACRIWHHGGLGGTDAPNRS